tara:strand:- start:850 stop:1452 length:603 start_codon:yes stop_codon:yes gene_type:complete
MTNYYAGFIVSAILHAGLILSFSDLFFINLKSDTLITTAPIPAYLIYEKTVDKKKKNRIKRVSSLKVPDKREIPLPSSSEDPQIALEELKQILLESKETVPTNYLDRVAIYADMIRDQVRMQWNQPPSAKLGMSVELSITLVPTGEIIDVRILKGSGNEAFDRSALIAVERVTKFEGLEMSKNLFDKHFRNFSLLFNPKE